MWRKKCKYDLEDTKWLKLIPSGQSTLWGGFDVPATIGYQSGASGETFIT